MNREQECLISLLKQAICEKDISCQHGINDEVDYLTVFRIAKAHSVANIAAYSIMDHTDVSDEIKNCFKNELLKTIWQQTKCTYESGLAFDALDKNGISCIPLKGYFLKNLYPKPEMRSMSDIDVFAEEKDMTQIYDIMTGMGFGTGTIGRGNHYEYTKDDAVKIEFHPELIALDSAFGKAFIDKNKTQKQRIADICNIWSNTIPVGEYKHICQLTPEYSYIYVIMHMTNHFMTAGTGIRSIIDVWIMQNTYRTKWNQSIIDSVLTTFSLLKFEHSVRMLAYKWFGTEYPEDISDIDEETVIGLQEYILLSGTYGIQNQKISQDLISKGIFKKCRYILRHIFLPYSVMKQEYKILNKLPVLLPIAWIYRPFYVFTKRKKSVMNKMATLSKITDQSIDDRKALFTRLGIS